ncbi:TonB family protein [Marinimicrobium sp. C6131]|uniref:TonB family protein n=1 Tax=Marinimicrobium sp. C6131 TaxID=3022676 RepID=UPI00223CC895|nr:TonB family protein [Marinimicrobium sp. C6131]UZJ46270.1 TonB family protein [Marinimicrobium sp. C6131]
MMQTAPRYQDLVIQWQPGRSSANHYRWWLIGSVGLALVIAQMLSLVEVPEKPRATRADIPDRVARFMIEQPSDPPVEAPEEVKPKRLPVVEPKPMVEPERERPAVQEPTTEAQREAREQAQRSGLLALGKQLDSLMDTSEVDGWVDTQGKGDADAGQMAAGYGDGDLASAAERTGARDVVAVSAGEGGSVLARRDLATIETSLAEEPADKRERRDSFAQTGRTDEEVSLVFDRNKGLLYSLYNRARRQTPGLQGRMVLEVTIEPSGEVTEVTIVSSELDDHRLEQRIRARVLQFRFEERSAQTITIIYPIEFLPS